MPDRRGYREVLEGLARADDRIVVMTAENRASIRDLPAALGVRFVDTGISEQTLVGAAAGLALRGRIPVVHALAAFLTMRAFEFIRTDVGLPDLPVKLFGGFPGILSTANGPTHQAVEDIALMRAIPNMGIFCPADEEDLVLGLPEVLRSPRPFYVRLHHADPAVAHRRDIAIGRAERIREGAAATLLVAGVLLRQAIDAAADLERRGWTAAVLNMRTVRPLDEEAVLQAANDCPLLVTVEDHLVPGGLYSAVCELLIRRGAARTVLPIGLAGNGFTPCLLPGLLEREGFTGPRLADRIARTLEAKGVPHDA
ncbi:MAG: transketolase C-terminal domain-containing protein [Candidatus Deferrimicrobium sp.]